MPAESVPAARGPGRPRSSRTRTAILAAAVDLVTEGGLAALSMSSIAARAGVSRVTLYKWWSSPGAIVLDGLLDRSHSSIEHDPSASARDAIAAQMQALITLFTDDGPTAAAIRAVTARAESDAQLARDLREHWHRPRREVAADILRRGIRSGEVRPEIDVEATIDLLFAPIYHRLLVDHAPLGPELVDQLLALFNGFAEPAPRLTST
ncbi:TetR/AcrR family transcriptional regulator [Microlunatus soli]|uniref:DNA-binding transcriptional regulator, AcrR family n=1 Tax=Microlunatus soli TaxID=630515 RepID=A0A1H1YPU3_9ACTN|nr:TetR/AcrR family transcriptional regulator [Microlunatus soli]SDT23342.1 DNA-binding transcriptional regulator, AcrR family [Microlunatus soli]